MVCFHKTVIFVFVTAYVLVLVLLACVFVFLRFEGMQPAKLLNNEDVLNIVSLKYTNNKQSHYARTERAVKSTYLLVHKSEFLNTPIFSLVLTELRSSVLTFPVRYRQCNA